jgi:hypothetical protein
MKKLLIISSLTCGLASHVFTSAIPGSPNAQPTFLEAKRGACQGKTAVFFPTTPRLSVSFSTDPHVAVFFPTNPHVAVFFPTTPRTLA